MCTKRDTLVFLAGAQAFHTISHVILNFTDTLPITVFSITWTQQLNVLAIAINGLATVGLFWWISRLK